MWIKFLGRMLGGTLLIAAASTAAAQNSAMPNYMGPGVASLGAGDIGMRSGEQLDLRFYAGVSGVVDTNLQPFTLDAQGNLLRIHNLYGVQANVGAYGMHRWKRALLGLDYGGNYHHYVNSDSYNGSDQHLNLGYTLEPSRHWTLDLHESVGTYSVVNSELSTAASNDPNSVFTPSLLLFDARTTFLQSSAYATYLQSARTSFTFGGSGFLQDQKQQGLSNSGGYTLTGSMQRRMSKASSVGFNYSYSHYEYPAFHSTSDSNTYHGTFATSIGRFWTFSVEAGITISEINSQITYQLGPELAALFGVPSLTENNYTRTLYPSGTATLQRKFRHASVAFHYNRGLYSGNGATGTARQENADMVFSYTGIRKVNLGVSGGHYVLTSIGQSTGKFTTFTGAAGITYTLGRGIGVTARYSVNQLQVDLGGYTRTSTGASVGLTFSPGAVPLALW
jgi:hypothetical protein